MWQWVLGSQAWGVESWGGEGHPDAGGLWDGRDPPPTRNPLGHLRSPLVPSSLSQCSTVSPSHPSSILWWHFHPLQVSFLGVGGVGQELSPFSSPNRSQNMPGRTTSHGHPQATDSGDALVSLLSKPILGTPQPEASPGDVMLVSPVTQGGDTGRRETPGRRRLSASGRGRVGAPSCAGWSGPS